MVENTCLEALRMRNGWRAQAVSTGRFATVQSCGAPRATLSAGHVGRLYELHAFKQLKDANPDRIFFNGRCIAKELVLRAVAKSFVGRTPQACRNRVFRLQA